MHMRACMHACCHVHEGVRKQYARVHLSMCVCRQVCQHVCMHAYIECCTEFNYLHHAMTRLCARVWLDACAVFACPARFSSHACVR